MDYKYGEHGAERQFPPPCRQGFRRMDYKYGQLLLGRAVIAVMVPVDNVNRLCNSPATIRIIVNNIKSNR